ncbi:MAG: hypothetical protein E7620_07375 [Ruminococcaceae bacterium]|nr:hypothetical protein [Oscillospiraceae bacterium]
MKGRKQWGTAALLLAAALLLCACEPAEKGCFSYLRGDFETEVEGNSHGRAYSCLLVYRDGACAEVRYLSPPALSGLTLERRGEEWRLRYGSYQTNFDTKDAISGLLLPMRLLEAGGREELVARVQKTAEGRLFLVNASDNLGELTVTVNAAGDPITVMGEGNVMGVKLRRFEK